MRAFSFHVNPSSLLRLLNSPAKKSRKSRNVSEFQMWVLPWQGPTCRCLESSCVQKINLQLEIQLGFKTRAEDDEKKDDEIVG